MACLKVLAANKITQMAFRCYRTLSEIAFSTLHPADPKGVRWSSKKLYGEKIHTTNTKITEEARKERLVQQNSHNSSWHSSSFSMALLS